jgi:succinate dehydrogenase/fumarate reductase cytochrome b subunit
MVNPWVKWILDFLVEEVPAAVDGKPGGTLSEWVWNLFNSRLKKLILLLFLLSLTAHLVFGTTVIPVIVFGAGMAAVIWRKEMNYESWLKAAIFAGCIGALAVAPVIIADSKLNGQELWMLATGFFGALFGWMKSHPPVDKEGDVYGSPGYNHEEKK